MLSVLIVVESVIPIGIEGRKIGVICFGELNRAEDVVTYGKIVVVRRLPLVVHRERIDISSRLHIRLKSGEYLIRRPVSVRLRFRVIHKSRIGRRIIRSSIRKFQRISQELNTLEIVPRRVVMLVTHKVDYTLAVLRICPSEASRVIIYRVLQFPRFRLRIGSIGYAVRPRGSCVLVQMTFIVCGDDDVEPRLFR